MKNALRSAKNTDNNILLELMMPFEIIYLRGKLWGLCRPT